MWKSTIEKRYRNKIIIIIILGVDAVWLLGMQVSCLMHVHLATEREIVCVPVCTCTCPIHVQLKAY